LLSGLNRISTDRKKELLREKMNLDRNSKHKSKKRSFFEYIKRMRMMELLEKNILKRRWKKFEGCDKA
jgi:hypothetical protein